MDTTTQLLAPIAQILFYGGLLVIMVGLPLWIWMCFRFFRDVHSISESLHWMSHCTKPQDQEAKGAAAPHIPAVPMLGRADRQPG